MIISHFLRKTVREPRIASGPRNRVIGSSILTESGEVTGTGQTPDIRDKVGGGGDALRSALFLSC